MKTAQERRSEAMKWWALLPLADRIWYADKAYDVPAENLTGRMIQELYGKLLIGKLQDTRGIDPEYCPECGSDTLEYQYDVDDYGAWYTKCLTCGWQNGMTNTDLS